MNGSGAKDKAAIVTGSTKGIGRAIAEGLLDAGARVAISARNPQEVAAAAKDLERAHPGRILARPCDVRREDQVAALFAETERAFGGVDILVNNAGVGLFRNLEEMSLEEWNSVIETNLTGVFLCSRAAIPRMRKRGGGYIFNISSLAGKNAFPSASAYNASKFGLNGMSEALMQEVRYDGIKVSYLMPGSVATQFSGTAPGPEDAWKIQPQDIARIVLDLLNQEPRTLPSAVEIRPSKPPRKG
ncbi:MAG: SDR family oxidoreductase [Candidatus Eisenbacteria bacterium]|uniref:SDR family oxidoreductase n=1 Tax=Eiseniibacteriota bacterium TaxID=2212470 RepID=A0A538TNF7_UNCEI|nr:MAG: SDR family oxidoreductase [Candidatus Eisenbacteria bacterium]TMQ65156.1 MAG: SDR family oxidoreductase [Candidatus Eisenbacteria bacterium]